jgi:hypothetical protein
MRSTSAIANAIAGGSKNVFHSLVRQLHPLCSNGGRDGSQREALAAQFDDALNRTLLLGHFDEGSALGSSPTKRDNAPKIALPLSLIGLYVADALANAVALGFCYRREDCKDELRNTIPGHVPAQIDHMETDAPILELPKDV